MAKISNILIGSGIALGAGYLIYKLVNAGAEANAFVSNLNFNIKPTSIKVSGKILQPTTLKLVVKIDVEFINPTKTSISFQKPNVSIMYKGNLLAQSKVSTDIVTIQPSGVSRIKDITFEIPLMDTNTISALIDMVNTVSGGITINPTDTVLQKVTSLMSILSSNTMTKLLPLFEVSLLVYVGNTPIPYTTKLG